MKIKKIAQSSVSYGAGMPVIPEPVDVFLGVRNINLALDSNPNTVDGWLIRKDNRESPVDKTFAEIALAVLEDWAIKLGYDGIAHVGVFNSRMARSVSGKPLGRISRHAYGRAIDFKGFVLGDKFTPFYEVPHMEEVLSTIIAVAKSKGFKVESLVEGVGKLGKLTTAAWYHIGIYQ
jgi:hypothetical protein